MEYLSSTITILNPEKLLKEIVYSYKLPSMQAVMLVKSIMNEDMFECTIDVYDLLKKSKNIVINS